MMKAAVLEKYGSFTWKKMEDPVCGDHDVMIRVHYAGICGSDQHIFSGDFHPRTPVPFIPGHEFAGKVTGIGRQVEKVRPGDLVTVDPVIWCGECPACLRGHYPACTSLKLIGIDLDGGFAELVAVREQMVYPLPQGVSPKHAALVEVLSIGFHACSRTALEADDDVLIYGAGKVGHSVLQAAKTITSGKIILVDVLQERLELAGSAYPDVLTVNGRDKDPVGVVMEETGGKGVDVAFEAVGHAVQVAGRHHPVRECIRSIRGGGTVCVLGLADDPAPVVMKELIWKEAKIVASRVSHGEFAEAVKALSSGKLNPDSMITAVEPGHNIQQAFLMMQHHPEQHLKVLLEF